MANTWLDRTISYISPERAAKRAKARALEKTYSQYSRKYEAASRGRRTEGWVTSNSSATDEVHGGRDLMRARARDLVRNNPWAAKGVAVIASNTVGDGIIPAVIAKNKNKNAYFSKRFEDWVNTKAIDAAGTHNIYSMQSLIMRTVAESGEVFVRRRARRPEDNLPVPFQLQILEADFLATHLNTTPNDGGFYTQKGIEYDFLGRRVAYHFYKQHPGSTGWAYGDTVRVDAKEVAHIYRPDRPGQELGVTWLAPVMIRLRELDQHEDAQLVKQKIASCITGFIYDSDYEGDGLGPESEEDDLDYLESGAIKRLGPGKQISFSNPPQTTDYVPYVRNVLLSIAAGLGTTYEALTGDLHETNFSSGRMGWLEFQRNLDQWRWNMLIPMFCEQVWQWFLEAMAIEGRNFEGVTCEWTAPARQMIDPSKEIGANIKAIRSGQKSLSETLREQGMNPQKVFEEIAAEQKLFDEMGLTFDSDARKTTLAGAFQIEADVEQEEQNDAEA